jgi:arsenite methyltransferase
LIITRAASVVRKKGVNLRPFQNTCVYRVINRKHTKGHIIMTTIQIHDVVKERYGAIASGEQNSCCGPDCCGTEASSPVLYDEQMLKDLPVDVTGLSLGCGDPVSIASLKPGETVLDLGSGGGIDCFLAGQRVGENGHVIGVDMTPAMLEKANQSKAKMGVKNVEFRQGNIEALPVADNTVDVVMSNCVINLSPDKPSVFSEVLRVLKPGGRVSISDIVTEGDFTPELRADAEKWAECVTGAIDANAYIGLMRDAGFVNIEVVDKVDAEGIVERQEGMPRIFSARITAYKPQ